MPKKSPLRSAQADAMSLCGKLVRKGQAITVAESAVGPRERKAIARGQVAQRKSNKPGLVQLVVL